MIVKKRIEFSLSSISVTDLNLFFLFSGAVDFLSVSKSSKESVSSL